jgi:predicted enzyme involved in methoxymalonyl-ACP biosynthesis
MHYHPGFKLIESENKEIKIPSIKKKDKLIKGYKTKIGKLYKKLANSKDVLNRDGSPRQNSVKERIKKEIQEHECKLKILK